jgi:hypothetical protein
MKKSINPQAIEIQKRFFEALDLLVLIGREDNNNEIGKMNY